MLSLLLSVLVLLFRRSGAARGRAEARPPHISCHIMLLHYIYIYIYYYITHIILSYDILCDIILHYVVILHCYMTLYGMRELGVFRSAAWTRRPTACVRNEIVRSRSSRERHFFTSSCICWRFFIVSPGKVHNQGTPPPFREAPTRAPPDIGYYYFVQNLKIYYNMFFFFVFLSFVVCVIHFLCFLLFLCYAPFFFDLISPSVRICISCLEAHACALPILPPLPSTHSSNQHTTSTNS